MYTPRVACIIPTYNGKKDLERLLDSLELQTFPFELFIVDSSSSDGTAELAMQRCKNFHSIPGQEFNHGGTRQLMVERNPDYDIYVFLTQDAYLEDSCAIEKIIKPFVDQRVSAVCGRQLPHNDANAFAAHARAFNYPQISRLKTLIDAPELGIKSAFMSNSFAAYRREALVAIGGFPKHVIFAEDMFVAAHMLIDGWKIAYEGSACCRHSHNYTLKEEFCRYFDMGVFHARETWIRRTFGGAGGEGVRYVKSELKYLGLARLHLWPESVLRNALKLLAYKLGQNERHFSIKLKKKFSMYKRYWDSPYAENN